MQVLHRLPGTERRNWYRLPISIPFLMRGRKSNGEELLEFTTALNVSAGGALLATRQYLKPGTQISLEVPTALVLKAQLPHSVSLLQATVLRGTPESEYFLLGVQFAEPLIIPSSESENDLSAGNPSTYNSPQ